MDRGAAPQGNVCHQYRRYDGALDERPFRLDPAPGHQSVGEGALLHPLLRHSRFRRRRRLSAELQWARAPGWWNGDTPDTIKDGYEYCMAAEIAYRAGLSKVAVINVAWPQLIGGNTKNYDIALSEASITEPRKKVVDFSVPYFSSDISL